MKQLQTELLTLCDYAMIDQANKMSIIGIFNELNVVQFPGGLPRVFLVAALIGSANTAYQLTVTVNDEKGTDIFPPLNLEAKTSFTGKTNLLININNFVVPSAGQYTVDILEKGKKVGSTTLDVIHAKQDTFSKISN